MSKIITCEQVSNGHPDKICDQIADAIVTDCLKNDKNSRVAIECLLKDNFLLIAGELTSKHKPNYRSLVDDVLRRIGYEKLGYGYDRYDIMGGLNVNVRVSEQSPDIALGVDKDGAGDQGIMYGYTKGNYNLPELPLNAERRRVYRKRISVCEKLRREISSPDVEAYLWDALVAYAGYLFVTDKGLNVKYTVQGEELLFNQEQKSITKATVMRAFHQARQAQTQNGYVSGLNELEIDGANYLYPVFLRIGVCSKKS